MQKIFDNRKKKRFRKYDIYGILEIINIEKYQLQ